VGNATKEIVGTRVGLGLEEVIVKLNSKKRIETHHIQRMGIGAACVKEEKA
jgi:hypothetical protein